MINTVIVKKSAASLGCPNPANREGVTKDLCQEKECLETDLEFISESNWLHIHSILFNCAHVELHSTNSEYENKLKQHQHAMFSLAWDIQELKKTMPQVDIGAK